MRLLERKRNGDLVFHEYADEDAPAYAILSHTWMANNDDEVIFQNIEAGSYKSKAGWKKITFCADKAAADGLRFFWIDTCCIDKKNSTELFKSINSMFRWYQKAVRCYVYLVDVSVNDCKETSWEAAFRKSRWFTRGWTLQELVAPKQVDFFSDEGERLGSKQSLEAVIHDVTAIPKEALRGAPLGSFSFDERMSWASDRQCRDQEDLIYSLLGIFEVSMALIYGEGKENARQRLTERFERMYSGTDSGQFSIGLDLSVIPEAVKFVSRENELAELYRLLQGHKSRSTVVLHGLGGIGKTQLAREYIRKQKESYTAIFWLNANDEDSLKLSFQAIASQVLKEQPSTGLLVSTDQETDLDKVVDEVKNWLDIQKNRRWLMIYDNYDNPKRPNSTDSSEVDLHKFLPRSDHGSIIITTRSAHVKLGQSLHVEKLLGIQEGLKILSNTSGRTGIENDSDAIALVKELDGLPLALSTAGAYLEHVAMSFSDYLRVYRASWLKLQSTSPLLSSYENGSLYTTWNISFDRIQKKNPAAAKLLQLWAYFDKQDLWFDLIKHAKSADDEWVQRLTEDELSFNEAITLLCEFGLVELDWSLRQQFGFGGYSLHSCVHSWTEFVLNKGPDKSLARLALTCVASEIPLRDDRNSWLLQRRLLQHAVRQERAILEGNVRYEGMEWALHNLGDLYKAQGKLNGAEAMYDRALQGYEQTLGLKHKSTLKTVNSLSWLYQEQGKLNDSNRMFNRALQGYEETLGSKHESTLNTVNSLGWLYKDQGRLAEAEVMFDRALQGYEETLGSKHKSTLETVYNLSWLYKDQGRLTEAEAMFNRTLQWYEETLGPKHKSTLETIFSLGWLYKDQGRPAEAEAMFRRTLQVQEKTLGSKHRSTIETLFSLGWLYKDLGRLEEAEMMFTQALERYNEAFGPENISTMKAVNNLGIFYRDQGRLADAESMFDRALQVYEEALGLELMSSYAPALNTMIDLGDLFSQTDRRDMAKKIYTRALAGYTTFGGASSNICRDLEGRLQKLEITMDENEWVLVDES